ncbi:MAG: hypothetical protein GEU90_14700 [Gemmatimonas sp.]|nr:hypothetical protein [Gemmatimonas sp.]
MMNLRTMVLIQATFSVVGCEVSDVVPVCNTTYAGIYDGLDVVDVIRIGPSSESAMLLDDLSPTGRPGTRPGTAQVTEGTYFVEFPEVGNPNVELDLGDKAAWDDPAVQEYRSAFTVRVNRYTKNAVRDDEAGNLATGTCEIRDPDDRL